MSNLVCECGRAFENSQSFNGHKSNCKEHLIKKYGTLEQYYAVKKANATKATIALKEKYKEKSSQQLQQWIDEKHQCEHCGKVMTEKFGSGRFCCRACANARVITDEVKEKQSQAIKGLKAYSNANGEVKYFNPNEVIPDGWQEGNILLTKDKKLPVKKKNSNSKKNRVLYWEEYRNFKSAYLHKQILLNEQVLQIYIEILKQKAVGKTYQLPESVKMSGKYLVTPNKTHPRAIKNNACVVHTHILLAEELLGRYLTEDEVVHHINEDKLDNRFDNIWIFDSKASHARFHYTKECVLRIDNDRLICDKLIYPKFDYDTYCQEHITD